INLLFSKKSLKNRVPERLKNEWENLIGNINKDYQLYLQYIKITDDLILLASNAEMVCNYGTFAKNLNGNIISLGYSNGMVGYIPTGEQINEGGYESFDSLFYFGYPNVLLESNEKLIKMEIESMIQGG